MYGCKQVVAGSLSAGRHSQIGVKAAQNVTEATTHKAIQPESPDLGSCLTNLNLISRPSEPCSYISYFLFKFPPSPTPLSAKLDGFILLNFPCCVLKTRTNSLGLLLHM